MLLSWTKTQILYESTNPKWNYFINMKIYDYETDVIRISCYDYDLIGSNDLIGFIDIPVKLLYIIIYNNSLYL